MSKAYFIHYWGGDAELAKSELGLPAEYVWFDSAADGVAVLEKLRRYDRLVTRTVEEGLTQQRTVAVMKFAFGGKIYDLEYDFGYEYDPSMAHFMFEDGNYSCDCNRSIFLSDKYPEIQEMDCGHTIEMMEFNTELRP